MKSLVILGLVGLAMMSESADILMVEHMPTMSHYHLFDKLAIQLAKKGHKVTLLSPFKQSRSVPNLTEIKIDNVYEQIMEIMAGPKTEGALLNKEISPWKSIYVLPLFGRVMSDGLMTSQTMQEFLKKDHKFDVLIAENFLLESIVAGLAFKFKLPVVAVVPFIPNYWANHLVGNPAPTSFVPDPILGFMGNMNFIERFLNTFYHSIQIAMLHYLHFPSQDAIMKKYFGAESPYILDILKNTSFALVNYHSSLGNPRPSVPNMVEIGGYHVPPPGQLPQDLKKILDESRNGVILFSMGSHLKSKEMPKTMIDAILKAFSRLKQTVLWKFEDDTLENLPENVIIRKWLPQSDVLAHPNLKLFITHGGLLSTIEAVHHGIPLVGIPVMGDQPVNMKYAANAGLGVVVPLRELGEESLYTAVTEVLNNPKYGEQIRRTSALFRDRPMKPMDAAVYWIEYVIRHKGAPHLRSPAQDLNWYQIYLLDVFAAFFVLFLAFVSIIVFMMRILRKVLCGSSIGNKTGKQISTSKKRN